MRHFTFLLLAFCLSFTVFAQNPNRVSIKGVVRDTSGIDMAFPTVMLLSPKDSSLVNFSRASEKGTFEFRGVKNAKYLLKVSYTGYFPLQVPIGPFETETADLGAVKIKTISKELMEIVVRTAKAPLTIRGDTIEYDATTFKVPPGSTVEDLLRRLPGIQLDAAGNIKAQGKDVKNVYVDGKVFFGGDAKAATKNLGAETISKVQVFDEKSEQAKLTGVDDGKKEKAVNLELKEEFKKGAFGKITLAAGTEGRLAARGNYNRFNKTTQFSVIGYGNNINETGVNWDDYGEFKGNNSWNWDNDDFGFSSRSNIMYMNEDTRGGVPTSNFDGRGFTNNAGSGMNYNYNHKKTKLSSSYFYNQTRLSLDQYVNKQTFTEVGSFFNKDSTDKVDFRNNHRVNFRWEEMADSSNTILTKADIRFSNSTIFDNQSQQYFLSDATTLQNRLGINNTNAFNSYGLSASMVFRHKYRQAKVKGRNFAASAGVNFGGSDGTETLFSLNRFFEAKTVTEQIRSQRNSNESNSQLIKASMSYLEPLAKKFYWESFYNFSTNTQDVGRGAFNKLEQERRVDSLSTFFTNKVVYNRLGSSFRYSNAGVNISVGLAAQNNDLGGVQSLEKNSRVLKNISKNFFAWTPNVNANIEFKNNMYMNASYNYGQTVPRLTDLQPVVNNNNPFYIVEGNPDLSAERNHDFNLSVNKFDPSSFAYINLGLNYSIHESQIVYAQTINKNRIKVRPENISGGKDLSGYIYASFPIVKTKLTFNTNGNISVGNNPTFINGIRNESDNKTYRFNAGFSLTPGENKLILDASAGFSVSNVLNSITTEANQKILSQSIDASMKWNFAKKFFLETNFDYNAYQNDSRNFSQTIPVWNASVRRLLTKDNKLEVRLAVFDLLNRRVSVRQNVGINYVSQEIAPTLARYFMVSLSYNMRGYQTKLKKNDW